jgi:hypothetical protein
MGSLIGNAKIIGTSTDEVVRTIQALISAGYKGDELLEKIDEIYGVGAQNNLLKVIDYILPIERTTVVIEYPEISPYEKTKIGDILVGSNGCIGQITEISFDSSELISSITVLGLGYNIIEHVLPIIQENDNNKALIIKDNQWTKDYVENIKNMHIYCHVTNNGALSFIDRNIDNDSTSQESTNRRISIDPVFVSYEEQDPILLLRLYDDDDSVVRITGIANPNNDFDAVNKRYVDSDKPFVMVFTGTTDKGDAACDKTWNEVVEAMESGKRLIGKYITYTFDDNEVCFDLQLNYIKNHEIIGNYLFIDDLNNITDSYTNISVIMRQSELIITYQEV